MEERMPLPWVGLSSHPDPHCPFIPLMWFKKVNVCVCGIIQLQTEDEFRLPLTQSSNDGIRFINT